MALHTPVPSDDEPTSIIDLVNDCREVASVLGAGLVSTTIDLTAAVVRVPLSRLPLDRMPFSFGAVPAEITDDLLVTVAGLEDY